MGESAKNVTWTLGNGHTHQREGKRLEGYCNDWKHLIRCTVQFNNEKDQFCQFYLLHGVLQRKNGGDHVWTKKQKWMVSRAKEMWMLQIYEYLYD